MAKKTFLRNYLRPGLLHRQSSSADRQLCVNPPSDKILYNHHHQHDGFARLQEPSPSASSTCSFTSLRPRSGSHGSSQGLPFAPDIAAPRRHACFPLLARSVSCSFSEADIDLRGGYGSDAVNLQQRSDRRLQQMGDGCNLAAARSHSCRKLPCSGPHVRSMESPLLHDHRHGRLHGVDHHRHSSSSSVFDQRACHDGSGRLRTAATSPAAIECRRSWSASSLRHLRKTSGQLCSFHGELAEGGRGSCGKGKRAPKGHAAVYVDGGKERVVVPIGYLTHRCFEELLRRAESEYGYPRRGGLQLPCSVAELHQTLNLIRLDTQHKNSH